MKKSLKHAILIFFSSAAALFIIFSPIFFRKDQVKSSNQNVVPVENDKKETSISLAETVVSTNDNSENNSKKEEFASLKNNDSNQISNEYKEIAEEAVETSSIQINQPSPILVPSPSSTIIIMPTSALQRSTTVEIQGLSEYQNYQVELKENDTAFSVLLRAAEENNFTISYQNYGSLGAFVDCIDSVCGSNNSYWAFYYNGQYSAVGASSQPVGDGDIISWRFED